MATGLLSHPQMPSECQNRTTRRKGSDNSDLQILAISIIIGVILALIVAHLHR